jgi:hypothetical protein
MVGTQKVVGASIMQFSMAVLMLLAHKVKYTKLMNSRDWIQQLQHLNSIESFFPS